MGRIVVGLRIFLASRVRRWYSTLTKKAVGPETVAVKTSQDTQAQRRNA